MTKHIDAINIFCYNLKLDEMFAEGSVLNPTTD